MPSLHLAYQSENIVISDDDRVMEFPLKDMYDTPRRSPIAVKYADAVKAFQNHRVRREDINYTLPLARSPKAQKGAILSGLEQFLEFVKKTPYPHFHLEKNLITGYEDYIQSVLPTQRPWRLVELGVGGAEKTERFLEAMKDNPPDYVFINDNSSSIIDGAIHRLDKLRRAVARTMPKGRTFKLKSAPGDFLAERTWVNIKHRLDEAQKADGVAAVAFMMLGATWNDFTEEQKTFILKKVKENGAHFFVSVDHTRDPIALAKFYDHAPLHDMTAAAVMWHDYQKKTYRDLKLNHAYFEGGLQIENVDGHNGDGQTIVRFVVQNKLGKVVLAMDDIFKDPPSLTMGTFEDCGFEVAKRLFVTDKICQMQIESEAGINMPPIITERVRENMQHYAGGIYHLRNLLMPG